MPSKDQVEADEYMNDEPEVDQDAAFEEDSEDTVAEHSSAIQSGWKAAKEAADKTSKFTSEFKFTEQQQLVKFLEAEPFAAFNQHWITRTGKKSFVCLGDDCPLCGTGDTPRAKAAFSVVNLSSEDPVVEILLTSPTLTRQLANFDADAKTGPLDRQFWGLSKSGTGQKTTYSVIPVKPRDLSDDWGLDIVKVESVIDKFEPLTTSVIYVTPKAELTNIAREISS